jgi:hypothetical protein
VPFHLLGKLKRVFNSWRNLRGDPCRRPFVDPCHLIEMHLTDSMAREGREAGRALGRIQSAGSNPENRRDDG